MSAFDEKRTPTPLKYLLCFIFLLAVIIPFRWVYHTTNVIRDVETYLLMHTIMEFFSIIVACMVFGIGWNTFNKTQSSSTVILSCTFLAVGMLDFAHALSYDGLPDFVTSNTPHKAIIFWLAARFLVAIVILMVVLLPNKPFRSSHYRYAVLAGSLLLTGLVYWIGLFHENAVPITYVEGFGLTPFKISAEYLIVFIHIITLNVLIFQKYRRPLQYDWNSLIAGLAVMILSELCFTLYFSVTDDFNLLGHIYKIISYAFIYKAVFIENVQEPYRRLHESQQLLRKSEEWFRTTLTSISDAIITTDERGVVAFMNPVAESLTGWNLQEAIGRSIGEVFAYAQVEKIFMTRYGRRIPIEHRESFIIDEKGKKIGTVLVFRDISRRLQKEKEMERLTAIVQVTPDFVATADTQGRVLYYNHSAMKLLGIGSDEDISGIYIPQTHTDRSVKLVMDEALPTAEREGSWSGETELLSRDGKVIPVSQVIIAHKTPQGIIEYFSTIARDITYMKEVDERQRLTAKIIENLAEGVLVTNTEGRIVLANPAFTRLTGYMEEELLGQNPRLFQSGRQSQDFYKSMWSSLLDVGHWRGEIWDLRKDGELYLADVNISSVKNEKGEVILYASVFEDITEKKKMEEKIEYQAYHDTLTGLPNRILFYDRLKQALAQAQRDDRGLAVMFLDLDGFKAVNDMYGHDVGDKLLQQFSSRVLTCIRTSDTVARLGGDEFIVLLTKINEGRDIGQVANKIIETATKPYFIDGQPNITVTASIGISLYPDDGRSLEALIRNSDSAMYRAKEKGKNNYRFFNEAYVN